MFLIVALLLSIGIIVCVAKREGKGILVGTSTVAFAAVALASVLVKIGLRMPATFTMLLCVALLAGLLAYGWTWTTRLGIATVTCLAISYTFAIPAYTGGGSELLKSLAVYALSFAMGGTVGWLVALFGTSWEKRRL